MPLFNPGLINSMILDMLFQARQSIHDNSLSLYRITDNMVSCGLVGKLPVLAYVFNDSWVNFILLILVGRHF